MGFVKDTVAGFTGSAARDAAKEGAAAQLTATREGIEAQERAYQEVAPGMAQFLAPQYRQAFQKSYLPEEFKQMPEEMTQSFEEAYPNIGSPDGGAGWYQYAREGKPRYGEDWKSDWETWHKNKKDQLRADFEQQQPIDRDDFEQRKQEYMDQFGLGGGGGAGGFGGAGTGEYSDDPLSLLRAASGSLGGEAQSNFFQNFQEDPGTQWLRNQGNRSIDRQSSAMGALGGGSRLKALSEFNQGLANQQLGQRLNQLGGLAQTDISVGSNLANLRTGFGTAQAQGLQNMGNIQANKFSNVADAKGQMSRNMMEAAAAAAGSQSDRRLKENIHKVGETKGLNIYSWTWRLEFEWLVKGKPGIGFIADEVEKKYPEAMGTDEHGFSTVNYKMILES
jgi:hypothetical protein